MLADLIREEGILFSSDGERLDTNLEEFGDYERDLLHHIAAQSGQYMTIHGPGVEEFLQERKNLYDLTSMLVQLWTEVSDAKFHVEADVAKLTGFYERDIVLANLLGDKIETADWMPEMFTFDKEWNFALCDAMSGFLGYSGYEWPRDETSFRETAAYHAGHFLVGTKEQLPRYQAFAETNEEIPGVLEGFRKSFKK